MNFKIVPDLHLPDVPEFKLPNMPELPSGKSVIRFVTDKIITNTVTKSKVIIREEESKKYRSLTSGEIAMCQKIFKNSINYSKVKIINKAFLPKQDVPVTPHGSPYYPENLTGADVYQNDFANPQFNGNTKVGNGRDFKIISKMTFIHEMTHVWQHQKGLNLIKRGLILQPLDTIIPDNIYDAYSYQLKHGSNFNDFNFEQQATIVSDYFGILSGFSEKNFSAYWRKYSNPSWKEYIQDLMLPIISNPSDFKLKGITLDNPITTISSTLYFIVR